MPVAMKKEKVRLVLLVNDETRATLRLAAAEEDIDMGELAEKLIQERFPEQLEKVRKRKKGKTP